MVYIIFISVLILAGQVYGAATSAPRTPVITINACVQVFIDQQESVAETYPRG